MHFQDYVSSGRGILRLLAEEWKRSPGVPLWTRVQCISRGFRSESALLYDFPTWGYAAYLSDVACARTKKINKPYSIVLDDKFLFERVAGLCIKVPKCDYLLERGSAFDPGTGKRCGNVEAVLALTEDRGASVLKPRRGGAGHGVFVLSLTDGKFFLNGSHVTTDSLLVFLGSLAGYLMTEYVHQHRYAYSVFPGAANTIRLVTMVDALSKEPFIAIALHRFGTKRSAPKDNFSSGGVSTLIDVDSGLIQNAAILDGKGGPHWVNVHPDTGRNVVGLMVPDWDVVKKKVLHAAAQLRHIPYIGWDILVTDGDVVAIEGNSHSSVGFQLHRPLLLDGRVRAFYRHHGLCR